MFCDTEMLLNELAREFCTDPSELMAHMQVDGTWCLHVDGFEWKAKTLKGACLAAISEFFEQRQRARLN